MIKTLRFGLQGGKLVALSLLFALMVVFVPGCTIDEPGYVISTSDSAVQLVDSNGDTLTIDDVSGAITIIDYVHHEIHEGDHYYLEGFTTLNSTDTLYIKLVTPDTTKWAHFTWMIDSSGVLETSLYEGASGGMASGAGVTPLNNNRNSTKASGLVITSGVTVATNKGTKISSKKVGGTGFKTAFGGSADRSDELILKQNTIYFREFISSSDDNVISFRASWYEHG